MTKEQFRNKYIPFVEKVMKKLLLDSYYPASFKFTDLRNAWASFDSIYPYKSLTINIDNKLIEEPDSKIRDILTHEVCHTLTDPLYLKGHSRYITQDEINDVREELTDHLANIFRKNKII
jgi:predicted metal-dependent hydrolase